LVRVTSDSLDFKLFPILGFGANMKRFDDFTAELREGRWQHTVGSLGASSSVQGGIDLLGQFGCLTVHVK
jgi:hypothetical protein